MLLAAYDNAGLASKPPAKATPPKSTPPSRARRCRYGGAMRPCESVPRPAPDAGVTATEHGLCSGHPARIALRVGRCP
jgi:hypothetical protein